MWKTQSSLAPIRLAPPKRSGPTSLVLWLGLALSWVGGLGKERWTGTWSIAGKPTILWISTELWWVNTGVYIVLNWIAADSLTNGLDWMIHRKRRIEFRRGMAFALWIFSELCAAVLLHTAKAFIFFASVCLIIILIEWNLEFGHRHHRSNRWIAIASDHNHVL